MSDPIGTVLSRNIVGSVVNLFIQLVLILWFTSSDIILPFAEQLLDWVKEWRIRGQKDRVVSMGFNQLHNLFGLMEPDIVHNQVRSRYAIFSEVVEQLCHKSRVIFRIVSVVLNLE